MSDNKIQTWVYRQLIGSSDRYLQLVKTKYKEKVQPTPKAVQAIKEWHKDTFYLYDRNAKDVIGQLDKFFEVMELAVKRFGCKLIIIDNLMAILEENADSLYSDQANFVQRCKDFAIRNWVHIVLIAHPNKEKGEIKNASILLVVSVCSCNTAITLLSINLLNSDDTYLLLTPVAFEIKLIDRIVRFSLKAICIADNT